MSRRKKQSADRKLRKPPRVVVINEEKQWWWTVEGALTVQGTGVGFIEDDECPSSTGPVALQFRATHAGKVPATAAVKLAMAVLEGDWQAALLLADLVQEQHLSGLTH